MCVREIAVDTEVTVTVSQGLVVGVGSTTVRIVGLGDAPKTIEYSPL